MCEVKARGKFSGQELKDIPVLNPGDWFGKAWLIEIGGSYSPLFLVAEADSVSDAIDELGRIRRLIEALKRSGITRDRSSSAFGNP